MPAKAEYTERPWLKYYLGEVPPDIEIPEKSVVETFDEATEKWKDKTALVFYGKKISYGELRGQVDRFATALPFAEYRTSGSCPNIPATITFWYPLILLLRCVVFGELPVFNK